MYIFDLKVFIKMMKSFGKRSKKLPVCAVPPGIITFWTRLLIKILFYKMNFILESYTTTIPISRENRHLF